MTPEIRDLHTLDEYRAVVQLEQEIWGYTDPGDVITVPVFIITMKRGGILIGAFAGARMIGFAFSLVGMKDGRPTQWSHMMGVLAEYRRSGLGRALKLAQRERAIAAGFDLMEWTFDPLQALNAHLNFSRLGVVCDEYVRNLYGESTSALHRGTPTDRFVVQWRLREPHVERRVARTEATLTMRASEAAAAPIVNETLDAGAWRRPGPPTLPATTTACGSRSPSASPRCSATPRIWRSNGATTRARSSKPTSCAATAPSTSNCRESSLADVTCSRALCNLAIERLPN